MAKKKLNKKVAIIGTIFLGIMAVGVIVVLLMMNRDPQVFLKDAESGKARIEQLNEKLADVDEPTLDQIEQVRNAYQDVEKNYGRALSYAKSNEELRIDILFRLADFYLRNERYHQAKWEKAMGCWKGVLTIDPRHVEARTKMLDFYYTAARSVADLGIKGSETVWLEVKSNADELVDIFKDKGQAPAPHILKAQARAAIEIADRGLTTELEGTAQTAIQALQEVITIDPQDMDAYVLLARAYKVLGQVRDANGVMNAMAEAWDNQQEVLLKATEASPESAKPKITLLEMKSGRLNDRVSKSTGDARQAALAELKSLEPEFTEIARNYPDNPDVYVATANYYGSNMQRLSDAVTAIHKAWQLDKNDIKNAMTAARLLLYKYNVEGHQDSFTEAVAITKAALNSPNAQDVPGPRQAAAKNARLNLFSFLGQCYATKAYAAQDPADRKAWTEKLSATVDQLVQFFGTAENPYAQKWNGLLALAQGDEDEAVRLMYTAYTTMKAAGDTDPFLSQMLAGVFADRREVGLRQQFLADALSSGAGSYKPDLLLDYAQVMTSLGSSSQVISVLDDYENKYGSSDRILRLKAAAYMRGGDLENAEQLLDKLGNDSESLLIKLVLAESRIRRLVNEIRLAELSRQTDPQSGMDVIKGQLSKYRNSRVEIFKQLIANNASNIPMPKATCDDLVRVGEKQRAQELMQSYAKAYPDNVEAAVYLKLLEQDNPLQLSSEQKDSIVEEALTGIDDKYESNLNLGIYYNEKGELTKAIDYFTKAVAADPEGDKAISGLFDAAIAADNISLAEEMAQKAASLDLDNCEGRFYRARLEMKQENYDEALKLLDICLEQKPVFPYAHVLKSKCYEAKEDYAQAINEISTADRMVRQDGQIAKQLVSVLQKRNSALGSSVTPIQRQELESALQRAVALNPAEWQIQAMYGQYLLQERPADAIAILQNLANRMPSAQTLVLLGNAAIEVGKREPNPSVKQNLFEVAKDAFSKAYALDPAADGVQSGYAEYLRVTGQKEKAVEMFGQDASTMWRFYVRDGQYDKAAEILQDLYAKDAKNEDVLKGLMTVALHTDSTDDIQRYSEELLAVADTVDNQLLQIQSYLEMDLIKEANDKLARFRENNPDEQRAVLLEAWAAMSRGELDKALELVNKVTSTDQKNAIAYRLRGQINGLQGKFDQAIRDLQESKNISSNPNVRMELARVYKRAGRVSEAIGELVGATEDDRAPMETWIMLENLYAEEGTRSELESFYRDTTERFSDNPYWYFKYAAFTLRDRKYSTAEDLFLKSLELSQTDSGKLSALDGYLTALRLGKKYDELYKFAGKYTDGQFAPVAYGQIATAKNQQNDRQSAVDNFNLALEAAGTNEQYVLKILDNMFKVLGADDVIAWCQDTLKNNPDSMTANLTMYKILQASGKFDQGLRYIEKCMQLAGDDKNQWVEFAAMKAQLLLMAYMREPSDKYLQAAIDQHEAILEKQPNNSNVMNNLAYLLAKSGDSIEQALKYAQRAHETAPNDHNKMDTYGYVLCKAGDYERAREVMLMAIQLAEKDAAKVEWSYYEHLGMAQEGLGEAQAAADAYKTALNLAQEQISSEDKGRLETALTRVSS